MQQSKVIGASGRLGSAVVEKLRARGDEIVKHLNGVNYLVVAHRYRGADREAEIGVNALDPVKWIEAAKWNDGDCGIVLVSSVDAADPGTNQRITYSMSKAALNAACRYLAKTQPIRINVVSPNTFTGMTPIVSIDEVANVIEFLCSPKASGLNGQNIVVSK